MTKTYTRPALRVHGKVEALTQGNHGNGNGNGWGPGGKPKPPLTFS